MVSPSSARHPLQGLSACRSQHEVNNELVSTTHSEVSRSQVEAIAYPLDVIADAADVPGVARNVVIKPEHVVRTDQRGSNLRVEIEPQESQGPMLSRLTPLP